MPAQEEIVHWYNQIPDIANGEIPDDYPATPNDYPSNYMIELTDLLNRLCESEGNITWEIRDGFVDIVSNNPSRSTYSFRLSQWRDNEREVKRYLREWFPSFNIPYTMGGIANPIVTNIPNSGRTTDSSLHIHIMGLLNSIRVYYPNNYYSYVEGVYRIGSCAFTASEYRVNKRVLRDTLRLMFPSATTAIELVERVDSVSIPTPTAGAMRSYIDSATSASIANNYTRIIPIEPHPRNPFNDRIRETLINVAIGLDTRLHYAIADTHVRVEDRGFYPVYTISLRLDIFKMQALPIVEISRRIRGDRAARNIPNSVTRAIESTDNPSTCNGKEEAPYTNYFDVI